ncbi:hypothetical protein A2344_00910 [Candidatus Peregrinibacteria bacterium RIFOXYB12_FULL_41_12]|nr:MAG: hypothetical protein A2344_00910 [Candidatus Peregrinibacteria bacterium RIFOXYB12_FULL_41_12]OGJ52553.1 MAG: hypothetical protein A2448_03270 [Candidatus Peregrinibacteria bacterium RIFOXYC2_FULL_41_22]
MKKLPVENKECGVAFSFEITPIGGCGFADRYLGAINKLIAKSDYWNDSTVLDKLIFSLRSWLSCLEKRKSEMMRGKWKKLKK